MKEHILSEIRRLVDVAGKIPGQETFSRETGIDIHKWRGIYWAKWSDAVKEAGYEPNKFQGRSDKKELLIKVAAATRHFQHFPTTSELRLYGKQNPRGLSIRTAMSVFVGRNELLNALRTFATSDPDYGDIISLLPEEVEQPRQSTNKTSEGFVYLLKSGRYFKVGRSDEIMKRVKQITITLPESVELIHTIRTDDPAGIEAYWHRRFATLRANGEWFKLGPNELRAFRKRKYQ